MIKLTTGYRAPRGLAGLGDGSLLVDPADPDALASLVGRAVVFGGVPLCALVLFRNRGPVGFAAGALGAGLAWLAFTGGICGFGHEPQPQSAAPSQLTPAVVDAGTIDGVTYAVYSQPGWQPSITQLPYFQLVNGRWVPAIPTGAE